MRTLALAALAFLAARVGAYPITGDNVNCRSGPGTSYGVVKQYDKNQQVTLTCQTEGTNIEGNKIWDKTTDGCYVSDYYVKTGVNGYVTSKCGSSSSNSYAISGDDVNCRSGPGTSYSVTKQYDKGHKVTLTCQTEGTNIEGNKIWDKTTDGCYVSDYYVKTGVDGYVTSKCSSSGGGSSSGGSSSTCGAPKSNQATVDLIAEFEGFRANVYTDPTGNPTVGYGHLCQKAKCAEIKYSIPLSQADGKRLLADDMTKFEKCITKMVKATLSLNQYGALVSWAFNMGCGAAESSTLVKRLNKGENVNTVLSDELPQWVHGNGEVLPGLVRRRNAEVALAKKSGSAQALPPKC